MPARRRLVRYTDGDGMRERGAPMIERLQRALAHIDELPIEVQEELATLIEERTEPEPGRAVDGGAKAGAELSATTAPSDARSIAGIWAGLRQVLRQVTPLALTYAIMEMERYTDLRRSLRPPYGSGLIGEMDTLVAATAIEHGLTLVITDGDLTRVPNRAYQHIPRAQFQA
jgi:predicted nucleic acid-binding protein